MRQKHDRGDSNWISGDINMIRQTVTDLEETYIKGRQGHDQGDGDSIDGDMNMIRGDMIMISKTGT